MRCEPMRATISVKQCLFNQDAHATNAGRRFISISPWLAKCKGCTQGALARSGDLDDGDIEAIKGVMQMDAETTEIEQMEAKEAKPDGALMTCKRCKRDDLLQEDMSVYKGKAANVCKDCKRELCKQASRAGRDKQAKRRGSLSEPPARAGDLVAKAGEFLEAVQDYEVKHKKCFCIDLTDYPEVYERIERIARDEDRTPECQVRYWLRKQGE